MENLTISDPPRQNTPHSGGQLGPVAAAPSGPPQLPPQMFTTAAQLLDLTDSEVLPPCLPTRTDPQGTISRSYSCSYSIHLALLCAREDGQENSKIMVMRWRPSAPVQNKTTEYTTQAANRGEPHRETYACPSRRKKIDWCAEELGPIWYAGFSTHRSSLFFSLT